MTRDETETESGDGGLAAVVAGRRVALAASTVATILLLLLTIRLLGAAREAATPRLRAGVRAVVLGDAGALGAGWFAAYLVTNGSLVAALAVSLLATILVSVEQGFLLAAGSRLGGSGIVLLVGASSSSDSDAFPCVARPASAS